MKYLTEEEPKNITMILVNLVGGWVVLKLAPYEFCRLNFEELYITIFVRRIVFHSSSACLVHMAMMTHTRMPCIHYNIII